MKLQSWQRKIKHRLESLARRKAEIRIAFVGIGNKLYGDDAVGIEIARALQRSMLANRENVLVVVGGLAPENYCHTIRRFKPNLVILIDTSLMNLPAGSVCWFDADELLERSRNLWSIPLNLLVCYLMEELGSEVGLIGVEPDVVGWGVHSTIMNERIWQISDQIVAVLGQHGREGSNGFCPFEIPHRKRQNNGA